jgi:GNAT superfamily N-acetyltransferase
MSVIVERANGAVLRHLDAVVDADPVRHTILATIREELRAAARDAWSATDGRAVAARSPIPVRPVALSEGWDDVTALASALDELEPLVGLGGPPPAIDALTDLLDRAVVDAHDERLWRCDAVEAPAGVPGRARRGTVADHELVTAWRTPYLIDVFGRVPPGAEPAEWARDVLVALSLFLWVDADGQPVSQAAVRPPVAGVARIGPVYTPPEHRGRGYAAAVTSAVASDVLARGAIPVLMTDVANPTSNALYRRIGFRPVADRRAVWFA